MTRQRDAKGRFIKRAPGRALQGAPLPAGPLPPRASLWVRIVGWFNPNVGGVRGRMAW